MCIRDRCKPEPAAGRRQASKGESGKGTVSRRDRRRTGRLLQGAMGEGGDGSAAMLETHVWHAKRGHMSTLWGHRLCVRPCDHGDGFLFKSLAEHCTLTDASYMKPIQLRGTTDRLLELLQSVLPPKRSMSARVIDGELQYNAVLHAHSQWPHHAIGPVSIVWRAPSQPHHPRELWVWVHPLMLEEAEVALGGHEDVELSSPSLVRFELVGQAADTVARAVFHPEQGVLPAAKAVGPGLVICFEAPDPRQPHDHPACTTELQPGSEEMRRGRVECRLWDARSRREAKEKFPSQQEINNGRRHAVRFKPNEEDQAPAVVPVMLIARGGPKELNGWDVVIPAGFGMAVWLPLISVSYTHLRAHETPEHLVCRLLLEKKNNAKQTSE
eukprot:TRINITY_DN21078_c0_g1_i2.p1 TRINITY_DN21078_c0_g1~~TRINITY_DN21078_c0_g1_i2.p1  ORF type:complete len:384 (+),score=94.95 TRINITY_DN21078_c0_g1_i2:182-1333(+)